MTTEPSIRTKQARAPEPSTFPGKILAYLDEHPGPQKITDIAKALGQPQGQIKTGSTLSKLYLRGLVERRHVPIEGRTRPDVFYIGIQTPPVE